MPTQIGGQQSVAPQSLALDKPEPVVFAKPQQQAERLQAARDRLIEALRPQCEAHPKGPADPAGWDDPADWARRLLDCVDGPELDLSTVSPAQARFIRDMPAEVWAALELHAQAMDDAAEGEGAITLVILPGTLSTGDGNVIEGLNLLTGLRQLYVRPPPPGKDIDLRQLRRNPYGPVVNFLGRTDVPIKILSDGVDVENAVTQLLAGVAIARIHEAMPLALQTFEGLPWIDGKPRAFNSEHVCCAVVLDAVQFATKSEALSERQFEVFLAQVLKAAAGTIHPRAYSAARTALSTFSFSPAEFNRRAHELRSMPAPSPYSGISPETLGWLVYEPVLREELVGHFSLNEAGPYLPFLLNSGGERYAENMLGAMKEVGLQVMSRRPMNGAQLIDIQRLITSKNVIGGEVQFGVNLGRGLTPLGRSQALGGVDRLNSIYRQLYETENDFIGSPYWLNSPTEKCATLSRFEFHPDPARAAARAQKMMDCVFEAYYTRLAAIDAAPGKDAEQERWKAIVSVVQDVELAHWFRDGNSRLSAILLLHRLAGELQDAGKLHVPAGTVPMFRDTWVDMLSDKEAFDLLQMQDD